jgi:NAD(P)-dependent dehydrogenase (short-subunit alcohol dehydrogenase family)
VRLEGRTVVVTGAAGGIGRALALRCAAEGARVAVTDIQAEGLAAVGDELGAAGLALPADVTDSAAVSAFIDRVEAKLGPVDVFFANAGVAIGEDPMDTPDDLWDLAFAVNVRAHVLAARRLLPGWLDRGEGYFVATASAAGLLTQIGSAPYAVTKHAAVAFAEWLSVTYGDRGLRVSCLCPMGVRTPLLDGAADDLAGAVVLATSELIEPDDVADAVVAGLATEQFLILPHPVVTEYWQAKVTDYDRWLRGMRRLQARLRDAEPRADHGAGG